MRLQPPYTYLQYIDTRIKFLKVFYKIPQQVILQHLTGILKKLWEILVINSLLEEGEQDIMFQQLQEFCDVKDINKWLDYSKIFNFFKEKIQQTVTQQGFKCFKNLFLVVNINNNCISKIEQQQQQPNQQSESQINTGVQTTGYQQDDEFEDEQVQKKKNQYNANQNKVNFNLQGYTDEQQAMQNQGIQTLANFISSAQEHQNRLNQHRQGIRIQNQQQQQQNQRQNQQQTQMKKNKIMLVNLVNPIKLEGIEFLWNYIFSEKSYQFLKEQQNQNEQGKSQQKKLINSSMKFLSKIYFEYTVPKTSAEDQSPFNIQQIFEIRKQFVQTCFSYIQKNSENNIIQLIAFKFLNFILNNSEKFGSFDIHSHSQLAQGEMLHFKVINEVSTGNDMNYQSEIKIKANQTVIDLRRLVGLTVKTQWEQIQLRVILAQNNSLILSSLNNGRTLADIGLSDGLQLVAKKDPSYQESEKIVLTTPEGNLIPQLQEIVKSWFCKFAKDANGTRMSPEQCGNFIAFCTTDVCKAEDRRVKETFSKFDQGNKGYLVMEDFIKLYEDSCKNRLFVVWENLHVNHFNNDLSDYKSESKFYSDMEAIESYEYLLPRRILSLTQANYDILFDLINSSLNSKIISKAWRMINRLPTNQWLLEEIQQLEYMDKLENWKSFININTPFKTLYTLEIFEYLMEFKHQQLSLKKQDSTLKKIPLVKNKSGSAQESKWMSQFIKLGGFQQLFEIFQKIIVIFDEKYQSNQLTLINNKILSFVLKIVNNYFCAVFYKKIPNLYKISQIIKHINFPFQVIDYFLVQIAKSGEIELNKMNQQIYDHMQQLKQKIEEPHEFLQLVNILDQELGQKIISNIDFPHLSLQLLTMIKKLLNLAQNQQSEPETYQQQCISENRSVLQEGLLCLVFIVLYNSKAAQLSILQEKEQDYPSLTLLIQNGLLCKENQSTRSLIKVILFILFVQDQNTFGSPILGKIFRQLMNFGNCIKDENSDMFFELIFSLVGSSSNESIQNSGISLPECFQNILKQLTTHQSQEIRSNIHKVDNKLKGFLNLLQSLITKLQQFNQNEFAKLNKKEIAIQIFYECLFYNQKAYFSFGDFQERKAFVIQVQGEQQQQTKLLNQIQEDLKYNYVKCKSNNSRQASYQIISYLISQDIDTFSYFLSNGLLPLFENFPIPQHYNYSPSIETRSQFGYVGLYNLGCICYMNAMLQQFFMCEPFRYSILMADDNIPCLQIPICDSRLTNGVLRNIDDNVLHQLQKIFAFLDISDRQDFKTNDFCYSFKDYTGQPVNVSEQKDAQEFLNQIFDKLEHQLQNTAFKSILDGIYGSMVEYQYQCQNCKNVTSTKQRFYNLSLQVRNIKDIQQSLDQFVTGETINDYKCEACENKVDVVKRSCLLELPNELIIHLQRITINMDTFMNEKINSRFEFPHYLNMEPFTKEGLQWREEKKEWFENEELQLQFPDKKFEPYQVQNKEYYEYNLKGVVVHTGTADFGHYYSYIKERNGQWFEFNDSNIRQFDASQIENECFGGAMQGNSNDSWGLWGGMRQRDNSKNAYILVYERQKKTKLSFKFKSLQERDRLFPVLFNLNPKITKGDIDTYYELEFYDIKSYIPANLYNDLWNDNHRFMLEKHLYSNEFYQFINNVLSPNIIQQIVKNPTQLQLQKTILKILAKISFEILAKSNDNSMIGELTKHQMYILQNTQDYTILLDFFVYEIYLKRERIVELLLAASDRTVRNAFNQIILCILNILINKFQLPLNFQKYVQQLKQIKEPYNFEGVLNKLTSLQGDEFRNQLDFEIVNLLEFIIWLMKGEVQENWSRLTTYFEFWRNFLVTNQVNTQQLQYAFDRDIPSLLIDFFLDRRTSTQQQLFFCDTHFEFEQFIMQPDKKLMTKSNIKFNIRVFIGQKLMTIQYDSLINCIDFFIQRSNDYYNKTLIQQIVQYMKPGIQIFQHLIKFNQQQQQQQGPEQINFDQVQLQKYREDAIQQWDSLKRFNLSQTFNNCLLSQDFFDKAIKDNYDSQSLFSIVQFLCFENWPRSLLIGECLLEALGRFNYGELAQNMETLGGYFMISDSFSHIRFELILGFPVLKVNRNGDYAVMTSLDHSVQEYKSFIFSQQQAITYGITQVGVYPQSNFSQQQDQIQTQNQSLLHLILYHRKNWENLSIIALRQLLLFCTMNKDLTKYLIQLKPPNYLSATFFDWIKPFVISYMEESDKYIHAIISPQQRQQMVLEILSYLEQIQQIQNELFQEKAQQISNSSYKSEDLLDIYSEKDIIKILQLTLNLQGKVLMGVYNNQILGKKIDSQQIYEKSIGVKDGNHISLVQKEIQFYVMRSIPLQKEFILGKQNLHSQDKKLSMGTNLSFPFEIINYENYSKLLLENVSNDSNIFDMVSYTYNEIQTQIKNNQKWDNLIQQRQKKINKKREKSAGDEVEMMNLVPLGQEENSNQNIQQPQQQQQQKRCNSQDSSKNKTKLTRYQSDEERQQLISNQKKVINEINETIPHFTQNQVPRTPIVQQEYNDLMEQNKFQQNQVQQVGDNCAQEVPQEQVQQLTINVDHKISKCVRVIEINNNTNSLAYITLQPKFINKEDQQIRPLNLPTIVNCIAKPMCTTQALMLQKIDVQNEEWPQYEFISNVVFLDNSNGSNQNQAYGTFTDYNTVD